MTTNLDLRITERMIQEYRAGTLSGYLDMTGQGLWFDAIADKISIDHGVVTQRQRGVIVWPPNERGW